jgi:hypothetical protein
VSLHVAVTWPFVPLSVIVEPPVEEREYRRAQHGITWHSMVFVRARIRIFFSRGYRWPGHNAAEE